MKKLVINPQVYDDLEVIRDYIAKDNKKNADKVVNEIVGKINGLLLFPNSGMKVKSKNLSLNNARYIIIYSYYIFYKVEKEIVIVHSVVHSTRDYLKIIK